MVMTFSHIGEDIIATMANRNPHRFINALGLSNEEIDWEHVQSVTHFAYPHCELSPLRDIAFDGQHKVDVVLWVKPESAIALELKLGMTRLDLNSFQERFLAPCDKSHDGSRIKGTMIAILERRFGCVSADKDLYVLIEDRKPVKLSPTWGLVMQQSVLDKWNGKLAALSDHVVLRSIQKLVHDCGGKQEFNTLVKNLLDFDYFDEWDLGMSEWDVVPAHDSERPAAPL